MSEPNFRFERRMSDAEALMWTVEKDPWMSSTFAALTVLDGQADFDVLWNRMEGAVADVARLRERVEPGLGRLAPPSWAPDPEFELAHHLRRMSLPAPGDLRQLLDTANLITEDPFDRTRPLWQFWLIDGIEGGRSALLTKLHHTITDGEGGVRLAEQYMDFAEAGRPRVDVDLDAVIAQAVADAGEEADGGLGDLGSNTLDTVSHRLRRQLGITRRALGDVAMAAADPARIPEAGAEAFEQLKVAGDQLRPSTDDEGSPLWRTRSRGRRLDVCSFALPDMLATAKALGGRLNDVFLTAVGEAASDYHAAEGVPIETLRTSFIVSTRGGDKSVGGNAFTPTKILLPMGEMDVTERFAAVVELTESAKGTVRGDGMLASVSGLANLLPTSLLTRVARQQAGAIDVATSNVKAAPIPVWVGGAPIEANYPLGPVAGTAANITLMSYCDRVDVGIRTDPAAIDRPERFRDEFVSGMHEVMAAAGITQPVEF